ncbi:macro domain-containing protein [Microbulbifer sp. 2201CG32-9]|uniref:macro domain-containing protein n=1 Tax=Microbulbifer sp. 2201CG32-9 TaxID=3232309 RepID=UPI00345B4DC3
MSNIQLICGDILTHGADALVCPAHKHLIRGRGLSAQIFDRAGAGLAAACAGLSPCGVGEARLTPGFDLPVAFLLHTVTPQWSSGDQWGEQGITLLRRCYESVLALAQARNLHSLLFPALGAGTNRFPHPVAAHQALAALHEAGAEFERLTVCLHTPAALGDWRRVERRFYTAG